MKLPVVVLGALSILIAATACAVGDEGTTGTFGTFGGTTQSTFTTDADGTEDEIDESGTSDTTTGTDTGTGTSTDTTTSTTTDGTDTTTSTTDTTTDTTTDGGASCGNGTIDPGETCDGNNFGGVTCVDLGYDGGTLTCTNCAVSTSSCTNAPQPGLGQLYSHCLLPDNCPGLDGCVTVSMQGQMDPYDGFCTNFCTTDAECFANVGGTAIPHCNDEPSPYCELDCSGGKTCPGGMMCISLVGGAELCF